jgi:serine/threonine protein kinase/tetratricopeptide (TPR) repeat protein
LHKPTEKTTRGPLRALSDWLRGTPPAAPSGVDPAVPAAREGLPSRIGHYAITGKLGQGGMGVVYLARDERLERSVAVKMMSSVGGDETARKRFWREARAAASINHPNVCQLYEIGEDAGELFIAMELLEGEALGERLQRGPLSVAEALPIGFSILAALSALHGRGIVHRDLKPSNVFLTPHGVKLLDFGLARVSDSGPSQALPAATELTGTGMVLGTPRYMAPEQVTGEGLDARSDLFAVGAILFEMLAGRPAFGGRNAVEILHATLYEQPPALTGSPAVAAADRVIRRALSKRPAERPATAEAMAEELRAVSGMEGDLSPALARTLTRVVVLPFRILRPDPDTDFLAFSLPDAIATSLSRIGSLVVRSSAVAARYSGETPDLKALAAEADVDRVVMGTLVRAGDQLRAVTQLVEAPGGTLLTSHTVQSSLGDLFQLQDDIARRVVEALALPLGVQDVPTPERPHNAGAYALYLRANELARSYGQLRQARELYEQSLALDPAFAPAWAQLGRCHRVIGKFIEASGDSAARAEAAFRRALDLDPRLSVAHKYSAHHEAETGHPRAALVRLLGEAGRRGNDPELFAGLVHACRYCGLFEQSIAAHEEARRLDPNVPSSLEQTILMTGDIGRLLAVAEPVSSAGSDSVIRVIGLGLAGRRDEALRSLAEHRRAAELPVFQTYGDNLMDWLERRPAEMAARSSSLGKLKIMEDPEALFQIGWLLCDVGELDGGLDHLRRAVAKGYTVAPTLSTSPAFDVLRGDPTFQAVLAEAEAGRQQALRDFREHGGERLLGR